MFRKLGTDRHALAGIKTIERALGYVAADTRQPLEIASANAAHERA